MVPTFNDEEKRFLDEVTRWVDECVLPNTRAWEKATFPDDIWKTAAKMGITSCVLPKGFGGRGYSCQTYAELIRIIAKGDPALAMIVGLGGPNVCATNNRVSLGATDERVKMEPPATAPQTLSSANRLAAAEHRQITTRTHRSWTPLPTHSTNVRSTTPVHGAIWVKPTTLFITTTVQGFTPVFSQSENAEVTTLGKLADLGASDRRSLWFRGHA